MLLRLSFISLIVWFLYRIPSEFLNLDIFKIKKSILEKILKFSMKNSVSLQRRCMIKVFGSWI